MIARETPRFLASVRDLTEASLAASLGVEVIDLKEPAFGALGAVPSAEQRRVVAALRTLGNACPPISATVGDLPFASDLIHQAICRTATSGVDIVKFGVYAEGADARAGFAALDRRLALEAPPVSLVVLLLADRVADIDAALDLARAALDVRGVAGVMLDTAGKGDKARRLPAVFDCLQLERFVDVVHQGGAFAGLAGCLGIDDIEPLAATGADILGFRGALCAGSRNGSLDREAVSRVYSRLKATRTSCSVPALAE